MQQYLTARRLIGVAVSAKRNGIRKPIQNSSRCPRQDLGSGRVVSIPVYVSCAERERRGCTDTLAAGGRSTCATLCLVMSDKRLSGMPAEEGTRSVKCKPWKSEQIPFDLKGFCFLLSNPFPVRYWEEAVLPWASGWMTATTEKQAPFTCSPL